VLSEWLPRLIYFGAVAFGVWQAIQMSLSIMSFYQGGFLKGL